MDGVLTDTVELHYQTWKRLTAEEGIPFSRAINEHLRGLSRGDSLKYLLGNRMISKEKAEELLERKNAYYLEMVAEITEKDLAPGVKELMRTLKEAEVKTAIASSSKNARVIIKNLGIDDEFDVVIDGNDVKTAKPAPDLFLFAAKSIGVKPEACMVIEDAAAGVEAAHKAGMRVIGLGPWERVGEADFCFASLAEIDKDVFFMTSPV
jgi:beta-phosphoglucomutase